MIKDRLKDSEWRERERCIVEQVGKVLEQVKE